MTEAGRHISDPSGLDAPDAARGNELVEENVRDGSHEGEVAAPLADQLVPRGKWDERFECRAHADRRAVGHEARHGLVHGDHLVLGHPAILTQRRVTM